MLRAAGEKVRGEVEVEVVVVEADPCLPQPEKSQEGCPDSLSAAGQGVRRSERVTVGGGRLP